jgi:hypothetical protein
METKNLRDEHAFVPKQNSLTALFPNAASGLKAREELAQTGLDLQSIEYVAMHTDREASHAARTSSDAGAEIGHVFQETFSDDDKVYSQLDKALAVGGSILSLDLEGREGNLRATSWVWCGRHLLLGHLGH